MNTQKRKLIFGCLALGIAASIWGGMYVVSKLALDHIPPFTLLWLRYLVGFIVLYILAEKQGLPRPTRADRPMFISIGFTGYFLSVGLQFIGTWLSTAHMGAILTSASPVFIVIFAYFMLGEALTLKKVLSVLLASAGVVIVVGWEGSGMNAKAILGNAALIGAAVTWGLLSVLAKKASDQYPPLVVTAYAIFWAWIFTTPAMLVEWCYLPVSGLGLPSVWLSVLYIGIVSTAGAFYLWNKGMQMVEAGAGSVFFFLQPLVGAFLGWLMLGEHLGLSFFAGGGCILLGVLISSLPGGKRNKHALPEPVAAEQTPN
ncbi:DMT family transporter [Aneurinibacillus sp. Ricciae_BoGa-3]|uniref:DMT family transporter n=1 Tax=Aneurinibacillus sp. Ricciae_BoGa-3 TaxID=3022697 RepID=UPI002341A61A|nr:DMT family transporter [Aneurinibacillus sp. Ricciae_BoGa-3]WCK54409.1 DMT family transporter [Aneurinibacillus sp. Ricciae_BoGa-3]